MSPCPIVILAALAASATVLAGPLTPPAGPPASTLKTLQQVEPSTPIDTLPAGASSQFRITQPGAYHLTGDLTFGGLTSVVEVVASSVTIDLRGYTISGSNTTTHGILSTGFRVTVRNGRVNATADEAILMSGDHHSVANVTIIAGDISGGTAIRLGEASTVRDCILRVSGRIAVGDNSLVIRCVMSEQLASLEMGDACIATDISISGRNSFETNPLITMGNACTLQRIAATNAFNSGIVGGDGCSVIDASFTNTTSTLGSGTTITLGQGAHVRGVRIGNWGGTAISTGPLSVIESCTVNNAGGTGIATGFGSTIRDCHLVGTLGFGIATDRSRLIDCTVVSALSTGIDAGDESIVERCAVAGSSGTAIVAGFNTVVRHSQTRSNTGAGVLAFGDAWIIGNLLDGDTIEANSADNVIEGNTFTDQPAPCIIATASGNLIIGNRFSSGGASNISAVAGNSVGTVVTSPVGAGPHDNLAY